MKILITISKIIYIITFGIVLLIIKDKATGYIIFKLEIYNIQSNLQIYINLSIYQVHLIFLLLLSVGIL
jgi:uncharacterized membrane protein